MGVGVYRFIIVSIMLTVLSAPCEIWGQASYIHIQSEADQVYTVQLQGATYQSSAAGYLIIPQLAPGSYTMVMGFGGGLPDYAFEFALEAGTPRAFSLRLGTGNGWTLFDMVDFSATRGTPATRTQKQLAARRPESANNPKQIRKVLDLPSTGGIDQVYIVTNGSKADTVVLFIHALDETRPRQNGYNRQNPPAEGLKITDTQTVAILPGRQTRKPTF